MSPIHDRMPVILPQSAWEAWLDPNNNDIESLRSCSIPAPDTLLQVRAVSTDVNNVRNKGPHLIDPSDGLARCAHSACLAVPGGTTLGLTIHARCGTNARELAAQATTTSARPIAVSSPRIAAAAASSSSRSTDSAALANAT